jgi:hypothetical protein
MVVEIRQPIEGGRFIQQQVEGDNCGTRHAVHSGKWVRHDAQERVLVELSRLGCNTCEPTEITACLPDGGAVAGRIVPDGASPMRRLLALDEH